MGKYQKYACSLGFLSLLSIEKEVCCSFLDHAKNCSFTSLMLRVAAYFEFEYKPNLRKSRPEQHLGLSTKFSYEEPIQFELGKGHSHVDVRTKFLVQSFIYNSNWRGAPR